MIVERASTNDLLLAAWTAPGVLSLARPGADAAWSMKCSADARYDVRLLARPSATWLRTPTGLVAVGPSIDVRALEGPPGIVSLPATAWRVLRDGRPTVIEETRVRIQDDVSWTSFALPSAFTARDVGTTEAGGLWVAGAVLSRRVPNATTEGAVLHAASETLDRVPHNLRPRDLSQLIRGGALEAYERIECWSKPLVLVSRTAWFLDDPSSWLVVHGAGRPRVHRLRNRTVRTLLPTRDGCLVATSEGEILQIDRDGQLSSLMSPASLAGALGDPVPHAQLYLRGISSLAEGLAVVVGLAVDGRSGFVWHSTALVLIAARGGCIDVLHTTRPIDGEPELLDCAGSPG